MTRRVPAARSGSRSRSDGGDGRPAPAGSPFRQVAWPPGEPPAKGLNEDWSADRREAADQPEPAGTP